MYSRWDRFLRADRLCLGRAGSSCPAIWGEPRCARGISDLPLTSCPAQADPRCNAGSSAEPVAPGGCTSRQRWLPSPQGCCPCHAGDPGTIPFSPVHRHPSPVPGGWAKPRWDELPRLLLTVSGWSLCSGTQTPGTAHFESNFIALPSGAGKEGGSSAQGLAEFSPAAQQLTRSCEISGSFSAAFAWKIVIFFAMREIDRVCHNSPH